MNPQAQGPPHPKPAVGVVVIENDRLLLIQRANDPYRGCWAVPGGKVEWGESLTAAAAREAEEETGLVVDVGNVLWVGETMSPRGAVPAHHNVLIDFNATVVGGALAAGSDVADAAFVPLAEVRQLPLTPTMYELLDNLDPRSIHYVTARPDRAQSEVQSRRMHDIQDHRSIRP
jgi:8-oxo-dGTP diphosphatase